MHKFFCCYIFMYIYFLLNLLVVFVVVFVTCARKSLLLEMNGERNYYLYVSLHTATPQFLCFILLILLKTTLLYVSFFLLCYFVCCFCFYFIRLCLIICIFRCGCECSILNECFISFYANQTRKQEIKNKK